MTARSGCSSVIPDIQVGQLPRGKALVKMVEQAVIIVSGIIGPIVWAGETGPIVRPKKMFQFAAFEKSQRRR